ncbi:INO80 complex subunit E [Anopheles bellator]|uniref:INO80 complex subunit E n=1 Tax=Anopheles bellator TaxID=139047 RepID=UPI002649389F|nr:INO80 complex subunit E [Anopheles bellator]
MLEGWYCRTMQQAQKSELDADANEPLDNDSTGPDDDSDDEGSSKKEIDYRSLCKEMKKKLKILLYENAFFQHNLTVHQRRLLKITRDRSFLLDRLLEYDRPELSSSDSEATVSSDDSRVEVVQKKRKTDTSATTSNSASKASSVAQTKRGKKVQRKQPQPTTSQQFTGATNQEPVPKQSELLPMPHLSPSVLLDTAFIPGISKDNHVELMSQERQLTNEEIERHLQLRKEVLEVVPEGELPSEVFSTVPSSAMCDAPNDETVEPSRGNLVEDCFSVDLNLMNV